MLISSLGKPAHVLEPDARQRCNITSATLANAQLGVHGPGPAATPTMQARAAI